MSMEEIIFMAASGCSQHWEPAPHPSRHTTSTLSTQDLPPNWREYKCWPPRACIKCPLDSAPAPTQAAMLEVASKIHMSLTGLCPFA